jgi:ADP-ribose pyrophosphatase YjhB (NUDIX family)
MVKVKMSVLYTCQEGCCTVEINDEIPQIKWRKNKCYKAGIFTYDPKTNRVLLVRSRGNMWGIPKGTLEDNETSCECAIRETKEETGLDFTRNDLITFTRVKNRATYYYAERPFTKVSVQINEDFRCNDATGISWIRLSCLEDCIKSGQIYLNQHTKILFKRFLNITFPDDETILISRKKSPGPRNISVLPKSTFFVPNYRGVERTGDQ